MRAVAMKIGAAFADQGAFSLANFVINIQLARLLSPHDYGLFALAFTIFTLANIVLASFLVEPMMINGSGVYSGKLEPYLACLRKGYWTRLAPLCALVVLVVGLAYRDRQIFFLISLLALGVGPLCFQLMVRRVCYLYHRVWIAAVGGMTYLTMIVVLTWVGHSNDFLTSMTGLAAMIAAAVCGTLVMMLLLNLVVPRGSADFEPGFVDEVKTRHFEYGRWAVLTAALSWIPGNIYLLLLPVLWGYDEVGLLRASLNLILPVIQFQMALTPLLLPWLVRRIESPDLISKLRKISVALVILPTCWTLGLMAAGGRVMEFTYDGKYEASNQILALLAATTIVTALILACSATIKAHSRPELLVPGYSVATVCCLVIGLPLMFFYGVSGAIAGMMIATTANLAVLYFQLGKVFREKRNPDLSSHA